METLKQKSFKAFAWDFSGSIASQIVSFIISIFLARILNPSDFGLLAMVNVIIALSSTLINMGLGTSLIQRKDVSDEHYGAVFFFNLVVGLVLFLILFASAKFVSVFFNNPALVSISRAMAFLFLLNAFGNVIRVKLRKELQFASIVKSNVLGAIAGGVIGITMAFGGFGVWSLIFQTLVSNITSTGWLFLRISWRPKISFPYKALKDLWSFGFKMFLSNLLDSIFSNVDAVIIGKLFNSSTLGLYHRAKSFKMLIIQHASNSLVNILFPVFSQIQDDKRRLQEVFFKSFHLLCFVTFLLIGIFYVTGKDLIILIYSSKWEAAVPFFKIMFLSAFGYPLNALLVNLISGTGNSKAFLFITIIVKVLSALNYGIGFIYGIEGFLYGQIIVSILSLGINSLYASRQIHISIKKILLVPFPYFIILPVLIFSIDYGFSILHFYNKFVHLLITFFAFISLYLLSNYAFRLNGMKIFYSELKTITRKFTQKL